MVSKVLNTHWLDCRHPLARNRPEFRELTIVLTGSHSTVLRIPQKDLHVHKLAGVLGSPLEAGKNMYTDLQNKHLSESENDLYD